MISLQIKSFIVKYADKKKKQKKIQLMEICIFIIKYKINEKFANALATVLVD